MTVKKTRENASQSQTECQHDSRKWHNVELHSPCRKSMFTWNVRKRRYSFAESKRTENKNKRTFFKFQNRLICID